MLKESDARNHGGGDSYTGNHGLLMTQIQPVAFW